MPGFESMAIAAALLAVTLASAPVVAQSADAEEARFVREVLAGNHDAAQQRLSRSMSQVDLDAARRAQRPLWTLAAEAEYRPNADGPRTVVTGAGGTTELPGEMQATGDASLGVTQALPTGAELSASIRGGELLPKGGNWQDTQTVGVSLRQPLLKGFGSASETRYALHQAQISDKIAVADLKARLLDIIGEARTRYWNAALRAHQLQVLKADSVYWVQFLRTAEARHRLGDLAEDEFLRFRIQALDARQNLLEGYKAYREALAEMALLLSPQGPVQPQAAYAVQGDSLARSLGLAFAMEFDSATPLDTAEQGLDIEHPTLIRLARLRERSEANLAKAKDSRKPSLDIHASYSHPIGGDGDTRLGATFVWELPSVAAERDVRKALLQIEAQKLDSLQTRRALLGTLARLQAEKRIEIERLALARERADLERKRGRIAERRHEMGDLDFTELQLSARERLQAEQNLANAYVAFRLLGVEMERWNGSALRRSGVQVEGSAW
jgi:outer membrane protein TolC